MYVNPKYSCLIHLLILLKNCYFVLFLNVFDKYQNALNFVSCIFFIYSAQIKPKKLQTAAEPGIKIEFGIEILKLQVKMA